MSESNNDLKREKVNKGQTGSRRWTTYQGRHYIHQMPEKEGRQHWTPHIVVTKPLEAKGGKFCQQKLPIEEEVIVSIRGQKGKAVIVGLFI
jgi:hypothetical protein